MGPLLASSLLCLTSRLTYWHFLGCITNIQLTLESLSQAALLEESLGDDGGAGELMVTHHWLKPTESKRMWELIVDVGQANLLGQRADLEGWGSGETNRPPHETYLPVRRADNKKVIAMK